MALTNKQKKILAQLENLLKMHGVLVHGPYRQKGEEDDIFLVASYSYKLKKEDLDEAVHLLELDNMPVQLCDEVVEFELND